MALDDRFDAMTTEVPTEFPSEWNEEDRNRHGVRRDYEESISGYRNYVTEMERMLGGGSRSPSNESEGQCSVRNDAESSQEQS